MSRRVYFIKPIGLDGPIKIGCSRSPDNRRASLETWSPFPLEIVAEIDGCDRIERRFHAKFFADRTHREWFSTSPELRRVIGEIQAGTFDIATLPDPVRLPPERKPGATLGMKWSEERKALFRRNRALDRVQRQTGLVLDWPHIPERVDEFIANPFALGITPEERVRRGRQRVYQHRIAEAEKLLAERAAA